MSSVRLYLKRSGLPVLLVLCLAALSVSYASADEASRPRALVIIGDPDAAVTGRLAVGTATPGSKALTVVGVIDFLGAGTVHNYFTQGAGNNMQINTNVDEANVVGDASRSQWKLVLGSSLDWFSIRRSPAGATYNEDALFFIEGSTGNVGIAMVDTGNGATIPFTFQARLHVETPSGDAVRGVTTATTGTYHGVWGQSDSTNGRGVTGYASATTGSNYGVYGTSNSLQGYGLYTPNRAHVGGDLTVGGSTTTGLINAMKVIRVHSTSPIGTIATAGDRGRLTRAGGNWDFLLERQAASTLFFVYYRNGVRYSGRITGSGCTAPPACSGIIASTGCCLIDTGTDSEPRDLRVQFGEPLTSASHETEVSLLNRGGVWYGHAVTSADQPGL